MAECLCPALREVLLANVVLNPHLCQQLLEGPTALDTHAHNSANPLEHIPVRPFFTEVCHVLLQWDRGGRFPIVLERLDHLPELPEVAELEERIATLSPDVQALVRLWASGGNILTSVHSVLEKLGVEGVLRCLRLRRTFATLDAVCNHRCFPIDKAWLVDSFRAVHSGNLTAGARALAKHCHRVSSSAFWGGELKGSEAAKNAQAEAILQKLLANAAWLNIHMLPHGSPCFEVRTQEGYGARWVYVAARECSLADTDAHEEHESASLRSPRRWAVLFRGFLEPQMPDGHDVGWRH
eukprot:GGOE01050284.1.p1 GENE.GGOE01050284.1~~GGOE01050284.1.p1  ORF type:complete len:296 (-),score=68.69 GGOE01050284.1:241-1128(-)